MVVLSQLFDSSEVLVLWVGVFIGGTESGRGIFRRKVDFVFEVEFGENPVLDGLCFGELMGFEGMDDIVSHHLAVAECGLDFVFEVVHLNGFLVIGMLEFFNK